MSDDPVQVLPLLLVSKVDWVEYLSDKSLSRTDRFSEYLNDTMMKLRYEHRKSYAQIFYPLHPRLTN